MHSVHYTDHASAACMWLWPVTKCCLLLQFILGGGQRAKTVDSRQRRLRRYSVASSGILFVYRSVVHVLVIWAKLIDTRGMGIGSVPCNGVWQARAYMNHAHNTLTATFYNTQYKLRNYQASMRASTLPLERRFLASGWSTRSGTR